MLFAQAPVFSPQAHLPETPRQQSVSQRLQRVQESIDTKYTKQTAWDALALTGVVMNGVTAPFIIFSPFLAKKIPGLLARSKSAWLQNPNVRQLLTRYSDKMVLLKAVLKISSFGNLLSYINEYQTGLNTQQPSKLLGKNMHVLTAIIGLKYPANMQGRIISMLGSGFWQAGARNDFENYSHMESRREFKADKWKSFFAKDCRYFIVDDLRHSMSLEPWLALKTYFQKREFSKPSGVQSALSSQLSFLAAALATVSLLPGLASIRTTVLEKVIPSVLFVSSYFAFVPLAARAWESRNEADGRMTLANIPLNVAGRMFTLSRQRLHLVGLSNIGGGVLGLSGAKLTSEKHNALVTYLIALHELARKDPTLKPQDVLFYFETHPKEQEQLRRRMGQVRLDFLKNALRQAALKIKTQPISFESILRSIADAHNEAVFKSETPQPHRHKQ